MSKLGNEFIPKRSVFATWDINGLQDKAKQVLQAGQDIELAVHTLRNNCLNMPEMKTWDGEGHTAAVDMLTRTAKNATEFADIAYNSGTFGHQGVGNVVDLAFHSLSSLKPRLDAMVENIEKGPLEVSDQWVVLLKSGPMDDARFQVLKQAQTAWQNQLNPLIIELGVTDADIRSKLAYIVGQINSDVEMDPEKVTDGAGYLQRSGVPDPSSELGRTDQQQIQKEAAATTVKDVQVTGPDEHNTTTTTLTMQDGSRQVIEHTPLGWDTTVATWYDPSGKLTSKTTTNKETTGSGIITTTTEIPGQMKVELWQRGDQTGGTVTDLTSGKTYPVPKDEPVFDPNSTSSDFFTHPYMTSLGGGLSALETYSGAAVQTRSGIPMLDAGQAAKVNVGAKVLGPGLSLAVTGYDVINAGTAHEKCVAGVSGLAGTAGGTLAGTVLGEYGPLASAGGAMAGTWGFGWLGTQLGENVVCK
ncbi:hypothetical protein OHB26_20985 [Nocardia sp. NBC_01503]|uniref:hypothetical protein n=1 Tax=Nocardia sp. NBC_01503 TaxID=2975997 RepID=UPI002E7AB619|nr:hypothetical protein [Nocardia sp. NBC_01503]WTL29475.1 hypothetical protein OHB26_20985 [Nocardia sp. NBC_01503]